MGRFDLAQSVIASTHRLNLVFVLFVAMTFRGGMYAVKNLLGGAITHWVDATPCR